MQMRFWTVLKCKTASVGAILTRNFRRLKHENVSLGTQKKVNRRIHRKWSHRRQDKPRLTAHAFRMTLVAQGKLPQIIVVIFFFFATNGNP